MDEIDWKEFFRPLREKNEMLKGLAERYCKTHFYGGDKSDVFVKDVIDGGPLVLVGKILHSDGPMSIDKFFSAFDLGKPITREAFALRSELNSFLTHYKTDENYNLYITKEQVDFLIKDYPQFLGQNIG
ncbi:hypothetical protein HYU07_03155 [Candidatus Woesearchaeota archaeon]|nr:hypothetical protein [Candidatus Woesearchaeota archaeon]